MERYREIKKIEIEDKYLYMDSGTSDGTQIKYHKGDVWYKVDNIGGEGLSEYLASKVLLCSNLKAEEYVVYEPVIINGKTGCCSKNCLKDNESLISFYRLWAGTRGGDIATYLSKMDYDDAIETVIGFIGNETGLDIRRYLANCMAFSMFIRNEDLHFNNYQLIYDGNSFREAPIMDNGRSMFVGNKLFDNKKSVKENIKNTYSKSFSPSYELNYNYLKEYCDLEIDMDRLRNELDKESESYQRDFLMYQAGINLK